MVDPNRKINRLTDQDIDFLNECEEEYSNRFTEEDAEFMDRCKVVAEPPIEDNWSSGSSVGHGYGRRNNGYQNPYKSRDHGDRGWKRHAESYSAFNRNDEKKTYDDRRQHNSAGDESGSTSNNNTPMNIRRDYGNFVAASRKD